MVRAHDKVNNVPGGMEYHEGIVHESIDKVINVPGGISIMMS